MSERTPRHIGVIPDGHRRWARAQGMNSHEGYVHGVEPLLAVYERACRIGVEEVSVYGCSEENLTRAPEQVTSIQRTVVEFVRRMADLGRPPHVIGNIDSRVFHEDLHELLPYCAPPSLPSGVAKLNLLVNYSWRWDLDTILRRAEARVALSTMKGLGSRHVSAIDLVVRSGGHHRLSGFLPAQTVYADVFVVDHYWPDFSVDDFHAALDWYRAQDVTHGR